MTIFTDCTKDKKEVKHGNKIVKETKFFKIIFDDMITGEPGSEPSDFDYVDLVRRRDKFYEFDFLVAYDEGMKGIIEFWYLGEAGDEFNEEDLK